MWRSVQVLPQPLTSLGEPALRHIGAYPLDLLGEQHLVTTWRNHLTEASLVRLRGFTVLVPVAAEDCGQFYAPQLYLETHEQTLCAVLRHATTSDTYLALCQSYQQARVFITVVFHRVVIPDRETRHLGVEAP